MVLTLEQVHLAALPVVLRLNEELTPPEQLFQLRHWYSVRQLGPANCFPRYFCFKHFKIKDPLEGLAQFNFHLMEADLWVFQFGADPRQACLET